MNFVSTHFIVVAVAVAVVGFAGVILQQRRSPQSTAAWLLFVILVPYLAIPAFVAFGIRWRHGREPITSGAPEHEGRDDVARMLSRYRAPARTTGNAFRLLTEAEEARHALMDLIESAEREICIMVYALRPDARGEEVCAALTRKAEAGVRVRLQLDAIGAFIRPRKALRALGRAGGEVRIFAPFLHGPLGEPVNQRNHRKMAIADGARLWAGGRNIGCEYLGGDGTEDVWRDLSFTAEGPMVDQWMLMFESLWDGDGHEELTEGHPGNPEGSAGTAELQLIPEGADQSGDALHDLCVTLMYRATGRIWIATPYFLPTDPLWEALRIARRRGVDVRLLIPGTSNQIMADLARGSYLRDLEEIDTAIYRYEGGMLHAKVIVIDDDVFVGSANFDGRSMLLNYEAMVMCCSEPERAALTGWFETVAAGCPTGAPHSGLLRRGAERLFRLIGPVL